MAFNKPEPTDDCKQGAEKDSFKVKNEAIEIDDSGLWALKEEQNWCTQETSSTMPIKTEPVNRSLEDWDTYRVIIKKDLDETGSGNELENPLFVAVTEEMEDRTVLDEDKLELHDKAQRTTTKSPRCHRGSSSTLRVSINSGSSSLPCSSIRAQNVCAKECLATPRNQLEMPLKTEISSEDKMLFTMVSVENRTEREDATSSNKTWVNGEEEKSVVKKENHPDDEEGQRTAGSQDATDNMFQEGASSLEKVSQQRLLNPLDKMPYKCGRCGKVFKEIKHLTKHIQEYTENKSLNCIICKKLFVDRKALMWHKNRRHPGKECFECNHCEQKFERYEHLTKHMQLHIGKNLFQCNYCDKNLVTSRYLTNHVRRHTWEKPFNCNQCKKAFIHKYDFNMHMNIHTGEKPFKCHQCGKEFGRRNTLNRHLHIHMGDQ